LLYGKEIVTTLDVLLLARWVCVEGNVLQADTTLKPGLTGHRAIFIMQDYFHF
jgi:hypothetical protein